MSGRRRQAWRLAPSWAVIQGRMRICGARVRVGLVAVPGVVGVPPRDPNVPSTAGSRHRLAAYVQGAGTVLGPVAAQPPSISGYGGHLERASGAHVSHVTACFGHVSAAEPRGSVRPPPAAPPMVDRAWYLTCSIRPDPAVSRPSTDLCTTSARWQPPKVRRCEDARTRRRFAVLSGLPVSPPPVKYTVARTGSARM